MTDHLKKFKDFPGARVLGMPFKKAVEDFITAKYGKRRVDKGLCLTDIQEQTPELRKAIKTYKERFGSSPFGIPSIRDSAAERLDQVLQNGLENATRLDRNSAMKMIRRRATELGLN